MLNLKKGLALVLAAATAFTFAPVANLGNAVEANAAATYTIDGALDTSFDFTLDANKTYTVSSSDKHLTLSIAAKSNSTVYGSLTANMTTTGAGATLASAIATTATDLDAQILASEANQTVEITPTATQAGTYTVTVKYAPTNSVTTYKVVANDQSASDLSKAKIGGTAISDKDPKGNFYAKIGADTKTMLDVSASGFFTEYWDGETTKTAAKTKFASDNDAVLSVAATGDNTKIATITTRQAGSANISFYEKECALSGSLNITVSGEPEPPVSQTTTLPTVTTTTTTTDVIDHNELNVDFAPTVDFETSDMKVGETRKGRFYNPISEKSTGGNIKASDNVSVKVEKDGSFEVTALKAGPAGLEITDNDCPFTGSVYFNVADEIYSGSSKVNVTVLEINGNTLLVKPEKGTDVYRVGDRIRMYTNELGSDITPTVGMKLEVTFSRGILTTYPAKFGNVENVTVVSEAPELTKGDSNCDDTVDMADVVLIMQALANPDKYGEKGTAMVHLTGLGRLNSDMDGNGLTVGDAQKIQLKLLGLDDDSEPLTPLAQAVGVDTTDEAIKLIRSYDLNDYNVNARETMKQMFESFKKDGFIYRFAEVTGDDSVKLRDDYVNPPVLLGPYANFEDICILYHVKAYDMNYQLYYFNRGKDYAGQSMSDYIKNRFGFNVTKVIDDKYFIFDSSKDGQNDISVIFALDDGHYCKVRCFGTEAELMKLAKSLKSVKLPLGEKKITDLNDVNALLIAYETEHKLPVSMITSISQGDKQVYVYLGTFDIKEREKVIEQMKNYMK